LEKKIPEGVWTPGSKPLAQSGKWNRALGQNEIPLARDFHLLGIGQGQAEDESRSAFGAVFRAQASAVRFGQLTRDR
jgi:hypothetical protein